MDALSYMKYPAGIVINWGNVRASVHNIRLVFNFVFRQS